MKVYGYLKCVDDAESPVELREVTFAISNREIDVLICFLQSAKASFMSPSATLGSSHLHLKDYLKGNNSSDTDLIVVIDAEN